MHSFIWLGGVNECHLIEFLAFRNVDTSQIEQKNRTEEPKKRCWFDLIFANSTKSVASAIYSKKTFWLSHRQIFEFNCGTIGGFNHRRCFSVFESHFSLFERKWQFISLLRCQFFGILIWEKLFCQFLVCIEVWVVFDKKSQRITMGLSIKELHGGPNFFPNYLKLIILNYSKPRDFPCLSTFKLVKFWVNRSNTWSSKRFRWSVLNVIRTKWFCSTPTDLNVFKVFSWSFN